MEENEVMQAPVQEDAQLARDARGGFIMSIISLVVGWGWLVGGIAGVILSAIALAKAKKSALVQKNPERVFRKITLPLGIVGLISAIGSIIVWTIALVGIIAGVVAGATAA